MQKSERDKTMPKNQSRPTSENSSISFLFSSAESRLFPQFGRAGQNDVKFLVSFFLRAKFDFGEKGKRLSTKMAPKDEKQIGRIQ